MNNGFSQSVEVYWLQIRRGDEWRNIEPHQYLVENNIEAEGQKAVYIVLSTLLQQAKFDELRLTKGTRSSDGEIHYQLMANFAPGKILHLEPEMRNQIFAQGPQGQTSIPTPQPASPSPAIEPSQSRMMDHHGTSGQPDDNHLNFDAEQPSPSSFE